MFMRLTLFLLTLLTFTPTTPLQQWTQTTQTTLDSLLALFRYEKNERYEDHGHYTYPTLLTTPNQSRCFLQADVADNGRITLRSYYVGLRPIEHHIVRCSAGDLYMQKEGSFHSFQVDNYREILTICDEDALAILRFIDAHQDASIRVSLSPLPSTPQPSMPYTYTLTKKDKHALVTTYQLYLLMQLYLAK